VDHRAGHRRRPSSLRSPSSKNEVHCLLLLDRPRSPQIPPFIRPSLLQTMSIAAVAVMGRQGQPIYLRDFDAPLLFDMYSQPSATVPDNDFFCDSLIEETEEQKVEWPCRMKYQFALLAAYEKAVQMLEGGWKGVGGAGPDACWMGLVCNVDGFHAYGERCFEGIPSCHKHVQCSDYLFIKNNFVFSIRICNYKCQVHHLS
jgi:hypothetical protein